MNRPNLRPLDRITDATRPEIGEVVFSCWATSFGGRPRRSRAAARCKVPGDAKRVIYIAAENIVRCSDISRKRTMSIRGTRSGRPSKAKPREFAPPVRPQTQAQKLLLLQRLNLTEAELADALAD